MTERILPQLPSPSRILMIVAGFFALTLCVYGASLGNTFVAWDDNYLIVSNPIIRSLSFEHIKDAFTSFDPELYDPLVFVVYMINSTIGGSDAFIFHLSNLLFHTLNALGVCWILYLLTKKKGLALVSGLIFALHPLNTEAVSWASALKDVLSTLFFLVSIITYLYYREEGPEQRRWYVLSIVALLLGLLSKVMVLTLPIVLILLDLYEKRQWSIRMILEKIPYFLLSIIFGIVALFGKQEVVTQSSLLEKLLMASKSTIFYIESFFVPIHLSVLYPYSKPITITSPDFFVPLILLIALVSAAFLSWNRVRAVSIGILFYLLTLIPTFFNFAKGGYFYVASDRYAYIPQIGLLLVLGVLLNSFLEKMSSRNKNSLYVISALVIVALGILSYQQSLTWKNTETLFLQTLRYHPDANAARLNLGYVYRESNMMEKALEQFNTILLREPQNALAFANIGVVYEKQGEIDDAIAYYKKGEAANPLQRDSFLSLGMLYEKQGKLDEALEQYLIVKKINPNFSPIYNNLGSIYVQKNDLVQAEASYKEALRINPYYADVHFNLAYIYAKTQRLPEAAAEYETTLRIEGEKPETLQTLVGIYAEQNKTPETIRTLKRLLAVDPTNSFAKNFLSQIESKQ